MSNTRSRPLATRLFLFALALGTCAAAPDTPAQTSVSSAAPRSSSDGEAKPSQVTGNGQLVPDCNGGTTEAPYWLTRILFNGAFCVQAPKNASLRVDYGTTLVAYEDLQNGTLTEHQAYYSLRRIDVRPGQREVVWAVCGGGGMSLPVGTRVVPTIRMDAIRAAKIGTLIRGLEGEESEYNNLTRLLRSTSEQGTRDFAKQRLDIIRESIETQTDLVRSALIEENHASLRGAGFRPAPTWGDE